ncbi:MAG TPA: hypothetical protein VK941_13190 [Gillisia sp.]|nr:hypothetical protein [Gillisia sp.]
MKNKLETELKDLAKKIQDSNTYTAAELQSQARELYEKLTILAFTEKNLASFSSEKEREKETAIKEKEVASQLKESSVSQAFSNGSSSERDDYLPDGTEYNDSEAITEPNTEKIKDIVAQMPPETQKLDFLVDDIFSQKNTSPKAEERRPEPVKEEPVEEEEKHEEPVKEEKKEELRKDEPKKEEPKQEQQRDFRDIGVDYDNLPAFEPVRKQQEKERPKSLNDRLKKGFNIGLNERLAFIRHLFEGNTADYNRVISQLSTFNSLEEAKKFIQLVVKPDYKHWQGKEEYENKFMELVENKFGH